MRTLANIIWHIPFCGFLSAICVGIVGILWVCTIAGAPIGFGLLQYAKFLLAPYSSKMVDQSVIRGQNAASLGSIYSTIVKICWYPFGIVAACCLLIQIAGMCLSVAGIPIAMILWKSLGVVLNPVNKICVRN